MKNKLTVIIPSRTQEKQISFIQRAVASVRNQTIANQFVITFLVGVDANCNLESSVSDALGITCIESDGASQAKALNAAARQVREGFIAFLEDDDQWMPEFLNCAMQAMAHCDFVSSTQMEVDESDELLRINDTPTPSGWLMPASTLSIVGMFNEQYRFHLDNEWLGRLSEKKLKRIHMVESTAPVDPQYINQVRPWLWNLLTQSAGTCMLARHESPYPLVKRLVHPKSGMAQIASNEEFSKISKGEQASLLQRFGRTPW